ncbi:hypothetical protein C5B42_05400 [Candidatus Cerribacteria bacterium 'Amazon FNV 2010 28 9']|uniref:Oligoendopeptidase F n=1 Tax=Candidatus Cerribacteria bacterium 'Amazon FNV 2010 28 9' TaxID=2081795 RepID=A0A317JNI1_9BACT|nr:MAG: hypothetical protein C5B42_05400 [Candidatus Cerribacteria bacterium 'Amazon FNV 2010 28 9']
MPTPSLSTTWDFSPLFANDDDPQIMQSRQKATQTIHAFVTRWKQNSEYTTNPHILRQALDEYNTLFEDTGLNANEEYYFSLRSALEQDNSALHAKQQHADETTIALANEVQFFTLALSHISTETQFKLLVSSELTPYRHFLEMTFAQSPYMLSEPEEKILNLKSLPAHQSWERLTEHVLAKENARIRFADGTVKKQTLAQLATLLSNPNKDVRDQAAKALHKIYKKHSDVGEAELNALLLNKKIDDELRGLSRPELNRFLHDDIDAEVVDVLVSTVESFYPLAHRLYELKTKLFNIPRLAYHERNLEYGAKESSYSYEQAATLVRTVFSSLDPEFGTIFATLTTQGNVDVYPKQGKASGAFCAIILPSQPTYILLNFTGKRRDVTVLAHECGHAINNELMKGKVSALDYGSPLSTAEVASTFMEDFVLDRLMKEATDEERLSLLIEKLDADISTIIRQVACFRFEQELHQTFRKQGYLPKETIGKLFTQHMSAYMGPFVEQSKGSENWWLAWTHIRTFFYVYSYASGLLISKSLQASVRKDHSFITQVKGFLSAGTSDSPRNIFARLGIDITDKAFWENGMREIEAMLNETETLAKKLGKI